MSSSGINCPLTWQGVGDITIFLGLVGLTLMEHGLVREGFSSHLLLKNWLQFSVGIVAWWLLGYGFAFGNVEESEFIGKKNFGGEDWLQERDHNHGACASFFALCGFFVLFVINGAISERTKYHVYQWYAWWVMLFAWPVVVAWSWGGGWLDMELDKPLIDNGGAINVHLFAGAFGLIGAIFLGPRIGRYSSSPSVFHMKFHVAYILGATLVILGIFGLNQSLSPDGVSRGLSAVNTWICAGVSSIVSLKLLTIFSTDIHTHLIAIYQGFIAGMICVSNSAYNTTPWQAGLLGLISGIVFAAGFYFCRFNKIDDVLNVTATFFFPGIIGGILPGFITDDNGCFWQGISGHTLATQVVGVIVVTGWSMTWAVILFGSMAVFKAFRLDKDLELSKLNTCEIKQTGWKLPEGAENTARESNQS
ncbi:amt_2 [Blepharisma stoltei]|uniref:Ammonium transporter AmtB-like domain-containing protein n=1 Tax=Blepharisma stoltei TaxID=1481888 RepID=A0AAU9JEW0_9CILI|nr:unnamed protein product [Blepharisma stoltei]